MENDIPRSGRNFFAWLRCRRGELLCIAGLVAVAALLRLLWLPGLRGHDDWIYLFYTRSYLNGQTDELLGSLWGLRFLIWFPIYSWFEVFGVSLAGAFIPGFLLGLGTIPVTWGVIRRLGLGPTCAFWGCVFLIFNPIDWMVAGTVRGDIEMSFYGGLILLCLIGMRSAEGRARLGWGFAAGVAWGLSALTKEWGYVFAWGFFAVASVEWAGTRRVPWAYIAVAAGFVLMWLADAALLRYLTGDWLRRVHASMEWYQRAAAAGGYVDDPTVSYRYLPEFLLGLKTERTTVDGFSSNHYPYLGPYLWLLLASLAWVGWRKGPARLVTLFVAGVLLWTEFGSMSWREYLPYHKEPRYFSMISVPAAVLMAVAAARALRPEIRREWRIVVCGGVAAILGATALVARENHRAYREGRDFLPVLRDWLAERPGVRMWMEGAMQQEMDLEFAYRFADPAHGHEGAAGWGALQDISFWDRRLPGDLVLVDRPWTEFAQYHPEVNRLRLRHVAFVRGRQDTAQICEYVPLVRSAGGYWLSDDEPTEIRRTYAAPGWNKAFNQDELVAGGKHWTHGIGVHARTELTYRVDPAAPWFSAGACLLDSSGTGGSVVFSVRTGEKLLYVSPVMRAAGQIENVRLDLSGAKEFTLLVEDAGDGETLDHAAWLEARMSPSAEAGHSAE